MRSDRRDRLYGVEGLDRERASGAAFQSSAGVREAFPVFGEGPKGSQLIGVVIFQNCCTQNNFRWPTNSVGFLAGGPGRPAYWYLILLLAGDIEENPGPTAASGLTASLFY